MSAFFEQKVKAPVVKLLKSGASPSSIALAMAFGISGGIFPIPGVTTVPVMAAIFLFRLNPVAAMLTNYLVTPLNIASVPVFMCVGYCLSISVKRSSIDLVLTVAATTFRFTLLHAIYMWLLVMPVLTLVIYGVLTPVLRRVMPKNKDERKHA
ncbi:hypothetical protein AM587_10008820 [Phytophthora nicotianae]|uniref:DUF2062 domain-containing protein n=1 Tax=Phytophthora nicotianae TaxID=4792 RepID=A0A0W8CDY6_PHYNI|nr:hypothetical protein AM587_10008820 [Phytophthora nicotianae]